MEDIRELIKFFCGLATYCVPYTYLTLLGYPVHGVILGVILIFLITIFSIITEREKAEILTKWEESYG